MQTEIKEINATSKEINLTVEAGKVESAYQKYLAKASKSIEVPGFRKGKAPLSMVEKHHSAKLRDYFEKDFVDEVFNEAVQEHDINFLLYPEVKELAWERGEEMTIKFEIEHEPQVNISIPDSLEVPFKVLELDAEVDKFIADLAREHATLLDVEVASEKDGVNLELSIDHDGHKHQYTVDMYAGTELPQRSLPGLLGARTGDIREEELTGKQIKLLSRDTGLHLDDDVLYKCSLEVNSVTRYTIPTIDDEFAKDMEFGSLQEMRAKIAEDLRSKVEHRNIEGQHNAIIAKLYQDNPFPLPPKTLRYIIGEEMNRTDPKYREMLYQYYAQNIFQEMVSMYMLKALRQSLAPELTDEMLDSYVEHLSILEDISPSAYREKYASHLDDNDFRTAAMNFLTLREISSRCAFVDPPEPEEAGGQTQEIEEES